jgi:hypothetical protein
MKATKITTIKAAENGAPATVKNGGHHSHTHVPGHVHDHGSGSLLRHPSAVAEKCITVDTTKLKGAGDKKGYAVGEAALPYNGGGTGG